MLPRLRSLVVVFLSLAVILAAIALQQSSPTEPASAAAEKVKQPRFWKGNLHTHSLWSDGDDFPEMIADWYKKHGYHFLTLSDHNVLSQGEKWIDATKPSAIAWKKHAERFGPDSLDTRTEKGKKQIRLKTLAEFRTVLEEPGRFLLIPGEEITTKYAKYPVHINGIHLAEVITPIAGDSVSETIRVNLRAVELQAKKTGWNNFAFVNHPNWNYGVRAEDMFPVEELRYFEIFNGHPGVRNYGDDLQASCERIWDIVLAFRLGKARLPIVYGMATDDAHGYHVYGLGKVNPGRGWIMVRSGELSPSALVEAVKAGDFYCSSGVTLSDVQREGNTLKLRIEAANGVKYRTQFIATPREVSLASEPIRDAKGQELPVTRKYDAKIGEVIAESDSLEPSYTFTGKELYVRARVISDRPHPNPYQKGDVEMAWTQPVVP